VALTLTWAIHGQGFSQGRTVGPVAAFKRASRSAGAITSLDASVALAELDDVQLLDACRAGRHGAFDVIVERHRRSVYQLCYRFVGNHEDASDLSQDVFLRVYRGLGSFRGGSSFATWLYRIGVNACLNRIAVRKPITEEIDKRQHVDTRTESPSERVLRQERGARVREAITQLPPKQRATLVLRMYQELSHEEIAEVLGSSVGAVKANFFHALGNLKRLLGDEAL
jgi:RNA polymerase sigma-70 factor (ECF subfamily)